MSAKQWVYVVEDNPGVMASVLAILDRGLHGFHLLGASTDGEGVEDLFAEHPLAILLTDLRLPGRRDGLDLSVRLKEVSPDTRCVLMTGYPSPEVSLRAMLAGVDALLYKPFGPAELCESLRAAATGQRVWCPLAAAHLADYLRPLQAAPEECPLAPQETTLLRLLCENKLLKEAADIMGISVETARTHRKRIYAKYGVHKLGEARDKFLGGGGETGPARLPRPA